MTPPTTAHRQREPVRLRMPVAILVLTVLATTAAGVGVGFIAAPLNDWLLSVWGGAPGLLRLAADLPGWLAVAVLGAAGLFFGGWLAEASRTEALALDVDFDGLLIAQYGSSRRLARGDISAMVLDGRDLVLFDAGGRQLARHDARELNKRRLAAVLVSFGYPFTDGRDGRSREFTVWSDGDPALDPEAHRLMRSRVSALKNRDFPAASEHTDELAARGIIVRGRAKAQEFRHVNRLRG